MKQAIALAGGGTKGAYQVGAWKAMRELGIPFDIVTGTSIGSVTAALMVQDDFDRAWELWTHITEEQIMLERADATPHEKRELAALAEHPEQLIARVRDWADLNRRTADISPYRALVHKYLDEARFFASPVDFGLMTARFPSFQPVEVRKQDIAPGRSGSSRRRHAFRCSRCARSTGRTISTARIRITSPSARRFDSARIASSPSVSSRRRRRKSTQITRS